MSENAEQSVSTNQPFLDKYVKIITEKFGDQVIEESYINQTSKDIPTLAIKKENWKEVAELLKDHEELAFDYLSNLHGVDYEKYMETVYYFYSYKNRQSAAVRVKLNRDNPEVDSITPLWGGANWNERETYDLLGIVFKGHPNLTRIMLPDDWVGYPLRKDYQPYDEGV